MVWRYRKHKSYTTISYASIKFFWYRPLITEYLWYKLWLLDVPSKSDTLSSSTISHNEWRCVVMICQHNVNKCHQWYKVQIINCSGTRLSFSKQFFLSFSFSGWEINNHKTVIRHLYQLPISLRWRLNQLKIIFPRPQINKSSNICPQNQYTDQV